MNDDTVLVGEPMSIADVVRVARDGADVAITPAARSAMEASREYVERLVDEGRTVYGISTGFGKLASERIAPADLRELQRNLIVSHAMGVGEPLSTEVVRAMLLLRAQSLALGHSGIRVEVVQLLLELLDRGEHPIVPCQGSVGASGDLAPLAHIALVLIGEGHAQVRDQVLPAAEALKLVGLSPVVLEAKEGLALINGTQCMTAIGALLVHDARELAVVCDIAAAMSLEALKGTRAPFDPRVTAVRPHPGSVAAAANVLRISDHSPIHASHADCGKIQDAYSLRCVPQVHGASRDAIEHVAEVITREINAVTDNPLIFAEDDHVVSAGNFHGQPVAVAMDYAKIAIAELANIAERRVEHMLDPAVSGLPAFLAHQGGAAFGSHDLAIHGRVTGE